MSHSLLLMLAVGLALAGWLAGRARAWSFRRASEGTRLAALPSYHGWYVALWVAVPLIAFVAVWSAVSPALVQQAVLADPAAATLPAFDFQRNAILGQAYAVATGAATGAAHPDAPALVEPFRDAIERFRLIGILITIGIAVAAGGWAFLRLKPQFTARTKVERAVLAILLLASLVAILTTLGILVSLVVETVRFFGMISPVDFLFGTHWAPDPMADPATADASRYGAIPLFWGTIFIGAIIAMIVAIPLGLMSAIYLTQYAGAEWRKWLKPALEILAGVPTVVYGYFAALTVAPAIRDIAQGVGIASASSESALAAGLVMGVMIIPFVSSMADDSIAAVPQAMRDGSLAMGATKSETIRRVLIPAALPGIVAGVMLAVSRAIGETMIVVMAASTAANLSANPLESMTTVTVQIVAMLTGEGSFDHPATLSAFALGFVLFMVTLALNFVALRVVRRFREAYASELAAPTRTPAFEKRLRQRYAAEKRFRALGLSAILVSVAVLLFLLTTMIGNGIGGFQRAEVEVSIDFTQAGLAVDPSVSDRSEAMRRLEGQGLPDTVRFFAAETLGEAAADELSSDAWREVATAVLDDPAMLQRSETFSLPAGSGLSAGLAGEGSPEDRALAQRLSSDGKLTEVFDPGFLTRSDATDPQAAGIWGALKGSMLTMLVTLLLAFPIGVLAALYLEEYAPRNRWTDLIEVSINNLAAVPSIIFGLLGLAVFLWIFPDLRSAPLIGGMTLALMTMPVIVISGRNAIKAVPPSIRDGALAIGASPVQVVFHHVLPLALPGILTGTIIGMARALGETAPLLMIGMRAFVATPPDGFTSPATVLPVQIFLWSDEIDRGFVERTSAAIIVLLLFLLVMNGLAIYLRNKFEKTW